MNISKILLYTLIIAIFSSCNNDDETPVAVTKESLLTAKPWKLVSAVANPPIPSGNGGAVSDLYAFMPSCSKDDLSKFSLNGTLEFDEGPTKCDPNDPQKVNSSWTFNNEKTVLTISLNNEQLVYSILELSSTTLKFTFVETDDENNANYTITAVYAAQ